MDLYENNFTLEGVVNFIIKTIFNTDFTKEESWSLFFFKK